MAMAVINRFLHWAVVGLVSPVLVLMIMSKGVSVEAAGPVMAVMSVAVVLFELPSGVLSDLIGRKRVYLLSIAVSMAALALLFFAEGAAAVCAAFFLYGTARAFSSGSIDAAFISDFLDRHGSEHLHRLMAAMGAGETAGLALGALAGGLVPAAWMALAPGSNPYGGTILCQLVLLAILAACTAFAPVGARRTGQGDARTMARAMLRESAEAMAGSPVLKTMLAGGLLWGFAFNAVETFWQPRLRDLAGGPDGSTVLFGLLGGGYFLAAFIGVLAMNAIRRPAWTPRSIAPFRALVGLAIIGLSFQRGVPGFGAFFLWVMLANGMMGVPEGTVFNAAVPEAARASFLSLSSLVMQAGGIVAALVFGALKLRLSIGGIWIIAGSVFLASSLLYAGAGQRKARAA